MWTDLASKQAANDAKFRLVFFASKGNALEAFELTDGLFGARPTSVQFLAEDFGLFFMAVSIGNDRQEAVLSGRLAIGLAVIALVADHGARLGPADLEQGLEQGARRFVRRR